MQNMQNTQQHMQKNTQINMQTICRNTQINLKNMQNIQKICKEIRTEIHKEIHKETRKIRVEYADFLYIEYFCKNRQTTQKNTQKRILKSGNLK
jgi:hypothetical protein